MRTALVIAPHADDETLGMGATLARLAAEGWEVNVAVMTGHGEGVHPTWSRDMFERVRGEAAQACQILGVHRLLFDELPSVELKHQPVHLVNGAVGRLVSTLRPDALYLPYFHDLHGDHSTLAYAGLVASRIYLGGSVRLLAMYETPTETHLMPPALAPPFAPTRYVDVSHTFDAKLRAWACYRSQHQDGLTPRHPEALEALARWRGAAMGVRYAEAFQVIHEIV
jgi:LmbE family N-acetylglucosaminyl deacetylase